MTAQDLVDKLLALPDEASQAAFLEQHASELDDQVADALKRRADKLLRANLQGSELATGLLFRVAETTGNPCHRALGLLAEANIRNIGQGLAEEAVKLYDQATELYRVAGQPAWRARSQVGKIGALARLGRYQEARECGGWAAQVLESHGLWEPLATLNLNLGYICARLGEDQESILYYDRARSFYERLGPAGESFIPWIDHDRALALRNLGQFAASIEASQGAYEGMLRSGQPAEAARVQQGLGLTYFALGRYNEGLQQLDQARRFFAQDGRQRDAILADLLAFDCRLQLGRYAEVLQDCDRVRGGFAALGTPAELGQVLLDQAMALAGLRRYDEAIACLEQARRLFVAEGSTVWAANVDLERAAIRWRQGQAEDALATAEDCMRVLDCRGLLVKRARAQLIAARAAATLSLGEAALAHASEALQHAESRDLPALLYPICHLLGQLAWRRGEGEAALSHYNRAIDAVERLRGRIMVEYRADYLEDKAAVYEDAIDLSLALARPERALDYAERNKSRALLDLLTHRPDLGIRVRSEEDRPLVEELMALRAQRDRLYWRWEAREEMLDAGWAADDESRQRAAQEVLAIETQITERWHRMLVRNADYAQDASLWQVQAESVQPYVPSGSVLLEYCQVHDGLVVFEVTREAVCAHRLPGKLAQVERLVRLFWLNLRAVPHSSPEQVASLAENARGVLRQLYGLLIAPLADTLASYTRVIVVPHGALHYLPFHALHDGQGYLLRRWEMSYLPNAGVLRFCSRPPAAAPGRLVLGHSFGGRLPHALEEARLVAGLVGAPASLEEQATLSRLRQAAEGCGALHLATHAEFRADNPLFSGIALDDGWLTTLDVFDLRLKASLVALSACETGRHVIGGGDELLGLMRAFLYAGTASLLLSLWTVDDCSTAQLMGRFYEQLCAGRSKVAALREAQLRCLAGDGDAQSAAAHAHPFYWAPFILVGDTGTLQ